jgi:hypothetical protein
MRVVAFGVAILLAGCSLDPFTGDSEALDRFSRAYTEFLDNVETPYDLMSYVGEDNDPAGYWTLFTSAFDLSLTDSGRLVAAESAIATYDKFMPKTLDAAADEVEKLDKEVQRLFETANAIHNQDYRDTAVQVAKYAREAQTSVASMQALVDRRTRLQRQTLSDVVSVNGSLVRVLNTPTMRARADETIKINRELQDPARTSPALQNLKDTFSALKGKTNLKVYPTEDELAEQKKGR